MTTNLIEFLDGPVVNAIYDAYMKRRAKDKPRRYLGASIIGKECKRALWYDFRWATAVKFDGRMYRLFETGELEEPRMVNDLRAVGANVFAVDPATGRQFEFKDLDGHMAGHMDACAEKIPEGGKAWHVLEFKTHNSKSFADLRKHGVQKSKPTHYAQMIMYMGWSGMTRALYLAKDKETDELYAERIKFDQAEFDRLRGKAESVIFGTNIPLRISDDSAHWVCKMCDHHEVCHGLRGAQKNCRTCIHSTPTREGDAAWDCELHEVGLTHDDQLRACGDHLHMPPLLDYATPILADHTFILYKHLHTGKYFVVVTHLGLPPIESLKQYGPDIPFYTSDEIATAHAFNITNPDVEAIRSGFGGTIVDSTCQLQNQST